MILRTVYLYISELGLPSEYTYEFTKASRFICNWLERETLKKIRFDADGFDRVVVNLCSAPKSQPFVNPSRVASVDIEFGKSSIDIAAGEQLAMLQVDLLRRGFEKCASVLSFPRRELMSGLDVFVEAGMRNEWLHKKRVFKSHGLVISLYCKMTQRKFELLLSAERDNRQVIAIPVFTSEPDEIVFEPKFKDVIIDRSNIVITTKHDKVLWSMPLANVP